MKRFFCAISMLIMTCAWGWGAQGHRIVAALAERHLTPAARAWLAQVEAGKPDLVAWSAWADRYSAVQPQTKPWHYITWPDTAEEPQEPALGLPGALLKNIYLVQTKATPVHERRQALRWIVHLMGDVHQPLHVGNGQDLGGNRCFVQYQKPRRRACRRCKRYQHTRLHPLWDTLLIQAEHRSVQAWAQQLDDTSLWQRVQLERPLAIHHWMQESRMARAVAYRTASNGHPWCLRPGEPWHYIKGPVIDQAYRQRALPVIKQRLQLAGLRLAHLLNTMASHQHGYHLLVKDHGVLK